MDKKRYIVITGPPSARRTEILEVLRETGYPVVENPCVAENNGNGRITRAQVVASADRVIARALRDLRSAKGGVTFFDGSYLEVFAWFMAQGQILTDQYAEVEMTRRYFPVTYLVAPPESAANGQGKEDLERTRNELTALKRWLPRMGYEVRDVPMLGRLQSAQWILEDAGIGR